MPPILLNIGSWWKEMEGFDKIFWFIAILFSLLFIIQTIFSFAAGDNDQAYGDSDTATELDQGIGYEFLTIKNFIAFFTIFGWTGVALLQSNMNKTGIIGFAFLGGCVVVVMMFFIMRSMSNLKDSGTLKIENALGKTATVYLLIPSNRKGMGKITIDLQGTQRELNAVTDDGEDIATGSFVTVTGILNNNILKVSRTQ